jgi:hypothetical protein
VGCEGVVGDMSIEVDGRDGNRIRGCPGRVLGGSLAVLYHMFWIVSTRHHWDLSIKGCVYYRFHVAMSYRHIVKPPTPACVLQTTRSCSASRMIPGD